MILSQHLICVIPYAIWYKCDHGCRCLSTAPFQFKQDEEGHHVDYSSIHLVAGVMIVLAVGLLSVISYTPAVGLTLYGTTLLLLLWLLL